MKDPRIQKLAHVLVNYSISAKEGERVLIEDTGIAPELCCALIEALYKAKAQPVIQLRQLQIERAYQMGMTESQVQWQAEHDSRRMQACQGYIGIRGGENSFELSDLPEAQKKLYAKAYSHKVHMQNRLPNTRWVVLRYPTSAMAQQAGMSTSAFEDFYFDVCTMDYHKMAQAMAPLAALMRKTDRVRIVGPDTDLRFSIKGQKAIPCPGYNNIPDGEVYTAPIKDSVEGVIRYNTPSLYQGLVHEGVCLKFEKGKIVDAQGNHPEILKGIFDSDEGARYVGEFAFGVNPYITKPMKDILFDEKIAGSFHFTPGNSYDECPNGNHSAVHWDLVMIQTPEYGGGEIYFDDVLIRKDGLFVLESLQGLNPDKLKS